jgi:lambda family phage holin
MAAIIAVLRVLYDDQETNRVRVWLEAAICGCLSLSASAVVEYLGAPAQAAIAVGGAIGFVGVTKLRQFIMAWLDRSTPKQ